MVLLYFNTLTMNKIGIMTKQMISYRLGKQVRLLALAALFLAPFWTWGQTSTQNVRKQGRDILGLFLVLMLVACAMPAKLQAQTHPYSGVWYMKSFKNTIKLVGGIKVAHI